MTFLLPLLFAHASARTPDQYVETAGSVEQVVALPDESPRLVWLEKTGTGTRVQSWELSEAGPTILWGEGQAFVYHIGTVGTQLYIATTDDPTDATTTLVRSTDQHPLGTIPGRWFTDIGDVDCDGQPEFISENAVYRVDGDQLVLVGEVEKPRRGGIVIPIGDVNGDGCDDLVMSVADRSADDTYDLESGGLTLYLGAPAGPQPLWSWGEGAWDPYYPLGLAPQEITLVQADSDPDLELIAVMPLGYWGGGHVWILDDLESPTGPVATGPFKVEWGTLGRVTPTQVLSLGDRDGDGRDDLVMIQMHGSSVPEWGVLPEGGGFWGPLYRGEARVGEGIGYRQDGPWWTLTSESVFFDRHSTRLAVSDLDGDGHLDLTATWPMDTDPYAPVSRIGVWFASNDPWTEPGVETTEPPTTPTPIEDGDKQECGCATIASTQALFLWVPLLVFTRRRRRIHG